MSKKILPVVVLLLLVAVIGFGFNQAKQAVSEPVDFHQTTYSGSNSCKDCHQEKHESWSKTYHRTMTQEANSQSVVAEFDGKAYTYWGYTVRPVKENNKYYFDYYQPEGDVFLSRLEIV
ncbi:MAG: hypothetical protein L3J52_09830, partial [Proteobacteria bacterium]|nr:hypothetical protein [Pseudomonadota bacterium]